MEPSGVRRSHFESAVEEVPVYLKLTKTVGFNVNPTKTVNGLKKVLKEKGVISEKIQGVFFSDQLLKDSERLVDRGVQRNSTLHLFLQNSDGLKLLVKIPSDESMIEVEATAHDTIRSIKSLIQDKKGIESDQFSLVYEGKVLEDHWILSSLNIENESTLFLVFCQKDVLSIGVKAPTGEVVKLDVKVTFTVADVKAVAGSMLGISVPRLFYAGQQLEDSKTLAFYDIKEKSMLKMIPLFQIFMKTWSGSTLTLLVHNSNTVQDVKEMVYEKLKIPVHHLSNITLAGKVLQEGRDLGSYCIQRDCTLYMQFVLSLNAPGNGEE